VDDEMSIELPLLPLHTVFFPRMLMPLLIFEERYQQMLIDCEEREEDFGIALIRSGQEVGGTADPYEIGTTAHIMRMVDMEDGRKHVIVRGMQRFIIQRLDHSRPYLVGEAVEYPLETGSVDYQLMGHVEIAFYRYMQLLKQVQGVTISISNLPDDPEGIAWMIAWGLQVNSTRRQELLAPRSLHELLQLEMDILREETHILSLLNSEEVKRTRPSRSMGSISLN
jgi:uncharacterized protein